MFWDTIDWEDRPLLIFLYGVLISTLTSSILYFISILTFEYIKEIECFTFSLIIHKPLKNPSSLSDKCTILQSLRLQETLARWMSSETIALLLGGGLSLIYVCSYHEPMQDASQPLTDAWSPLLKLIIVFLCEIECQLFFAIAPMKSKWYLWWSVMHSATEWGI